MQELFNEFTMSKHHQIITYDHHHVPGLANFSHRNMIHPQHTSPTHYHSNIFEIYCMIKGQRRTFILENNSWHYYAYIGSEVFITFPNEIHGIGQWHQSSHEYYALQIDISNPSCMFGLNPEYSQALCNLLSNLPDRHLKIGATHINYLRTAFNFFLEMTPSSIQTGVQFLMPFLFSLTYMPPVCTSEVKHFSKPIESALLYAEENITAPIQVIDLAEITGYSLSHFKNKFKSETGITPAEYINMKKINHAKDQLERTNISVTELAHTYSFSSSNYFCSVFKKYLNLTPSEYRKTYQKKYNSSHKESNSSGTLST